MSLSALQMKKDQVENEYVLHPDSRSVTIIQEGEDDRIIPALYDRAVRGGKTMKAEVARRSTQPHLTCFTGNVRYDGELETPPFKKLKTNDRVTIEGKTATYSVQYVDSDLTEETYQSDIWLMVVSS